MDILELLIVLDKEDSREGSEPCRGGQFYALGWDWVHILMIVMFFCSKNKGDKTSTLVRGGSSIFVVYKLRLSSFGSGIRG